MARAKSNRPTDGELEILQILWRRGPSTVREVFRELNDARGAGYTTVLKLMQIMAEKGTVHCDRSVRPQVYSASKGRSQVQKQLLKDFVERAFGGSPGALVMQALSTKKATAEELEEIRELLDRLEEEQQ